MLVSNYPPGGQSGAQIIHRRQHQPVPAPGRPGGHISFITVCNSAPYGAPFWCHPLQESRFRAKKRLSSTKVSRFAKNYSPREPFWLFFSQCMVWLMFRMVFNGNREPNFEKYSQICIFHNILSNKTWTVILKRKIYKYRCGVT